jgi:alanine racemase
MLRQTYAEINLSSLKHNLGLAKSVITSGSLMPVIKANGYGHGLLEVAKSLGSETVCVALIDEAMTLRSQGVQSPIVVLEGYSSLDELAGAVENKISVVIHNKQQINLLAKYELIKAIAPLSVWIKVNTGMNRLGFLPDQVKGALSALVAHNAVNIEGFMTHFATADEQDSDCFERQKNLFERVLSAARLAYPGKTFLASAANSAAILSAPSTHYDFCRPGIMLYGASPFDSQSASSLGLKAVMNFCSTIISIQSLVVGEAVGYGQRWVAKRASRIAVVAAGYADGYPRHAIDGTPVSIQGVEIPLAGRVSMDMLTVDVTDLPQVKVGDEVQLWGDRVSVDRVASCSSTIGYELLTSVAFRVPRRYL